MLLSTVPVFIKEDSPDLSVQNYDLPTVQTKMHEHVYKLPINCVNVLKQWLIETWTVKEQCIIDDAADEWQKWLQLSVSAEYRHFYLEMLCLRRVSLCLCVCLCVCHTPVLYQNG